MSAPASTPLTPEAIHALAYQTERHSIAFQAVGELSILLDTLVEYVNDMRAEGAALEPHSISKALIQRGQQLAEVCTAMLSDDTEVSVDDASEILARGTMRSVIRQQETGGPQ